MAATQIRGANAGVGTSQIKAGTISDADIHASAAIALTKLAEAVIQADGGQAFTADQSMGGFKLTNVASPIAGTDAANKNYVDSLVSGVDWKASVRAATTVAGTLASSFENGDIIDGVTLATGDRILIKNQAAGADNGIYTVNASGVPTRATDADISSEVTAGMAVFVEEGTTNADSGWLLTNDGVITLGSTALVFTQFTALGQVTAGAGLTKTGNTIDVIAADTSITVNADSIQVNLALHIKRETPSGSVNSSNVTFTLANTPVSGSEEVYLNGLLQEPGAGNDYTISGATITYLAAPLTGDRIRVSYIKTP